jgi:hypothetical protein
LSAGGWKFGVRGVREVVFSRYFKEEFCAVGPLSYHFDRLRREVLIFVVGYNR